MSLKLAAFGSDPSGRVCVVGLRGLSPIWTGENVKKRGISRK